MKIKPNCLPCLKNLAKDVVLLSKSDDGLFEDCCALIERRFTENACPPDIANMMLRLVKARTGVDDPFCGKKDMEFEQALEAAPRIARSFPPTLEGALRCSVVGNSVDFFTEPDYAIDGIDFSATLEQIESEIDRTGQEVLFFADNIGEFLFDLPLIEHLQGRGKKVFYAVKEAPAQNDVCLADVERLGLRRWFSNFISTGADSVGIRKDEMSPTVRRLWEGDGLVIAKGMGNYETVSEFDHERKLVYIMKLKCRPVAESVGGRVGQYIAILGGDHG